jgi:hypothetical protein
MVSPLAVCDKSDKTRGGRHRAVLPETKKTSFPINLAIPGRRAGVTMTDSEKRKLIRNVKAEVRGALLRRWYEDADLIYNVRDTLDPRDPLAAEIYSLGKDAAWIRELPKDSDEGIQWEQRRAAVVRAAARRIC